VILGIDASNIRSGGGVTHLVELLRIASPTANGFSRVIVWSGQQTLNQIEDRPWLVKSHQEWLDRSLPWRVFWQRFRLSALARAANCRLLFIPGGSFAGNFRPYVTMSRNLLPFEWRELLRSGWSPITLKIYLLRLSQTRTFHKAGGLIFLTEYAKNVVMGAIKKTDAITTTIPHGIDDHFKYLPKKQLPIDSYSTENPFRLIYVSHVVRYKHQWHVAEAVAHLYAQGYPVILDLAGAQGSAMPRLRSTLEALDPQGKFIRYLDAIPYKDIHSIYHQADLCLFASSCENMPNTLLEGMAAGLPIACSNRGPMPEMLGDAGVYFDPEKPHDIARALKELLDSHDLRSRLAHTSFDRAQAYSWSRCASDTFKFLSDVASR